MRSSLVVLLALALALTASPAQVQAKRGKTAKVQKKKKGKKQAGKAKNRKGKKGRKGKKQAGKAKNRRGKKGKRLTKRQRRLQQRAAQRKASQIKAARIQAERQKAAQLRASKNSSKPKGLRAMRLEARLLEAERLRRRRSGRGKKNEDWSHDPSPEDSAADTSETQDETETFDGQEPALPEGLGGDGSEPSLPEGLGGDDGEPGLPEGLGGSDGEPDIPDGLGTELGLPAEPGDDSSSTSEESGVGEGADSEVSAFEVQETSHKPLLPFEWTAFLELRAGTRIVDDPNQERKSMDEVRMQLHADKNWDFKSSGVYVTADFVADRVADDYDPDLESGRGAIDLREAYLVASPTDRLDIKIGRQTLTWGTGDLLFINDLFPKDWNALLLGRDMDYLKAPSDAARMSFFNSMANLDVVYTPRFDADRYPDRKRLSSWDPLQQRVVGQETPLAIEQPDEAFTDDEWAARLHRRFGLTELAAYYYRGYWKSPAGINPASGAATFPKLSVYGASIRRPWLGGIAHAEVGYYDSRIDRDGTNPFLRNSETRALVGLEREAMANMTIAVQYYAERMQDHDLYKQGMPPGAAVADEIRHVATIRARYLAMDQTLELSLFGFASPNEQDAGFLPSISYSISDEWKTIVGANVFLGKQDHTFFGQLENNTNAFLGIRASWL